MLILVTFYVIFDLYRHMWPISCWTRLKMECTVPPKKTKCSVRGKWWWTMGTRGADWFSGCSLPFHGKMERWPRFGHESTLTPRVDCWIVEQKNDKSTFCSPLGLTDQCHGIPTRAHPGSSLTPFESAWSPFVPRKGPETIITWWFSDVLTTKKSWKG